MREVSATALQAMLAQATPEVFVPCLKIDHESFANPILLAFNTEALARAAGSYMPYAFQIDLPGQHEDSLPQVKVTVDNVDLQVNDAIRTLVGPPTVTMDVVLASSPDVVEIGPFEYSLQSATANADTIQGVLGFEDDIFSQQVPGQSYQPSNSAGLFL
jgi:hypothetical protein